MCSSCGNMKHKSGAKSKALNSKVSPVVGKKMHKVRFTEDGRKRVLNYGQQSSQFNAAHREEKRLYPEKYSRKKK